MAVLHQQCQPALPPGPLPPPFAEEKRPSAGHPGSNMAAPAPEAPEASEAPWSGAQRSLGALGLPSAGFGDRNGRAGPGWARRGPPSAAAPGPCEAPGALRTPAGPRAPSGDTPVWWWGQSPAPGPAWPRLSGRPIPGSGLPREASLTPQASSGRTKRSALAVGSTVRSTSRGQGTEGSRGLGPSPMMPPPPQPPRELRRGSRPTRVTVEGSPEPQHRRQSGPVPGAGAPSGQLPRDGRKPSEGGTHPRVCPGSRGPVPVTA
ncbi:unnamed protein product [Nyctereutes procyonoides]|uniref:(raccoon dog) hypothetical protein n=1 Tax=Nyctereutes procyonoides TaxID=34880 RepID=A0A811Z1F7_NYCPR|nr:unnamed protein product [Nyctereutes procyonoides]